MKKIITIMAGVGIALTSVAQLPQITSLNQIPAINDTIYYQNATTFGFSEAGSGGITNVIWDYQTLTSTSPVKFWYEDPAPTAEAANFPTATVAMANSVAAGYEYFETSANAIKRLGYTDPNPSNPGIYYNTGWNRYTFPLDMGVSIVSAYAGTMGSFGVGEDSATVANGSYTATPDAYGTLTLPALSFGGNPEVFNDVVRVHVVESFQIKVWSFGTAIMTVNINDDYYFWFDEQTQEPVLIFGTTTDDAGGQPQTVLRYQAVAGSGSVTPVCNLTGSVSGTNTTSAAATDGAATATPTGGQGNITYLWSNGAVTQTISGLAAGTYTVTITDDFVAGCTATANVVISNGGCTLWTQVSGTNETFSGASNGTAQVDAASGGDGNYVYTWSNGANTISLNGLAPGTYTVTVTDGSGCTPATGSYTVLAGACAMTVAVTGTDETALTSSDGTAAAAASSGDGNYTYLWSNAATTASISGLTDGTYTVTATDGGGCTATGSVVIANGPNGIAVNNKASNVNVYPNPSTGMITVKANNISNVSVKNVIGQTIYSAPAYGVNSFNIDLTAQQIGIYFVTISTNNSQYTEKFIIK